MSKWAEIRSGYFDENQRHYLIDAWKTNNPAEEGKVIARVYEDITTDTLHVIYADNDTKYDKYAQEVIRDLIKSFGNKYLLNGKEN